MAIDQATKLTYQEKRASRYSSLDYMQEVFCFGDWRGKKVLVVGCEQGIDAVEFAMHGVRVTAIDTDDDAIALTKDLANEAGVALSAIKVPIQRIPYKDETFDCVYCFGLLSHLPDAEKALSEINRSLKMGGTIMAMVFHRDSLFYAYSIAYLQGRKVERGILLPFGSLHDAELLAEHFKNAEGYPYTKVYTKDETRELFEGWFTDVSVKVCYNTIDVIEERKVKLGIEDRYELGWHLVVKGKKS